METDGRNNDHFHPDPHSRPKAVEVGRERHDTTASGTGEGSLQGRGVIPNEMTAEGLARPCKTKGVPHCSVRFGDFTESSVPGQNVSGIWSCRPCLNAWPTGTEVTHSPPTPGYTVSHLPPLICMSSPEDAAMSRARGDLVAPPEAIA
jgi:hypothetical protein